MYTWSIKVAEVGVTRVGSEMSCERSSSCIIFDHLVFVHECRSILKSSMTIYSRPVVCAMESSSSKRSIHSLRAFGGRYTVHTRKDLAFGSSISAQMVSKFEILTQHDANK